MGNHRCTGAAAEDAGRPTGRCPLVGLEGFPAGLGVDAATCVTTPYGSIIGNSKVQKIPLLRSMPFSLFQSTTVGDGSPSTSPRKELVLVALGKPLCIPTVYTIQTYRWKNVKETLCWVYSINSVYLVCSPTPASTSASNRRIRGETCNYWRSKITASYKPSTSN